MLVLKVTFRGSSLKEFAQHYLTDLSPTGMFVRTQTPLPVGTKIRFEFRLENDIPLLFGQGIVFWVAEENRELRIPCGMEIRFDSLSPESENHFQWLQLEKRGVTVGTEVPLYIVTTTTSSDPSNSSGKDHAPGSVGRSSPPAVGTGTLHGMAANGKPVSESTRKPPTGPMPPLRTERAPTGPMPPLRAERAPTGPMPPLRPARAPTGPLQALNERIAGPRRALAVTPPAGSARPRIEVDADRRETLPYLRAGLEDAPTPPPGSRLPVLARPPRVEEGLTGYRPAEPLGPGDSDPAKMFSKLAPRAASLSGRQLDGQAGRDTLLTVHELGGRRVRVGGFVLVLVGVLALLVWWLIRSSAPSTAGPGSGAALSRLVRVASSPTSAEVLVGNKLVGLTPLELAITDEPMLQLRHSGFLPEVVSVSTLDPRWRTEGGKQVLELKVTLLRAAVAAPDASPADAAPEKRPPRRAHPEQARPKRTSAPDEPKLAPEPPEAKKPEVKAPEPEAKKPEAKKPEPEPPEAKKPAKPAVKTPDWAGKPEGQPEPKKKVKAPTWAD